jgi:hypothetical protein
MAGSDDSKIPEARLQPKGLAEHVERAGVNAKHGAARAARTGGRILLIAIAVGLALAALAALSAWRTGERETPHDRMQRRIEEADQMRRRFDRARNRQAKDLQRRADEIQRRIEAGEDPLDTIDPEIRRKYLDPQPP